MSIASRGARMAVDWEQRIDFDRLRTDRLARTKAAFEPSELGGHLILAPACTPAGRGGVEPAIRLNAFMPEFPARYVLTSLCDDSMEERLHQIAGSVTGVMTNRPCLLTDKPVPPHNCRAFDVDENGVRTPTHATIVEDTAMCGYTPTHLRADVDVPVGHHVDVECLQ